MSSSTRPNYPTVEVMLRMAEKLYLDMTAANEWSGVTTKAGQSAFVAGNHSGTGADVGKLTCWNCGVEGHSLKECPTLSNPAMVEKHKKAFTDAKKQKKKDKKAKKAEDEKPKPIGK
jgi:Zinc knuckle